MNNIKKSALQRYDCDGLELIIDCTSGAVYANQNAIARMVNVSKQAISKWIGVNQFKYLEAEILTAGGLQGVNLYDEAIIYEAFAKYKPELLIQCAKAGIRVYLHRLAGFEVTSEAVTNTSKQQLIKTASFAIDWILKDVPIREELKAGAKLSAIEAIAPELKPALEPSRQLLINNTAQPYQLLTPTDIGKRFGLSGQKVNQLLIEKDLQIKNINKKSKKEANYLLTEKGKQYGELVLSSGKNGDSSSYQQLRWYESVLTFF